MPIIKLYIPGTVTADEAALAAVTTYLGNKFTSSTILI